MEIFLGIVIATAIWIGTNSIADAIKGLPGWKKYEDPDEGE